MIERICNVLHLSNSNPTVLDNVVSTTDENYFGPLRGTLDRWLSTIHESRPLNICLIQHSLKKKIVHHYMKDSFFHNFGDPRVENHCRILFNYFYLFIN